MAQIHVLDSDTIDKIAAGEVVERPSSVVKELVENSIDAGADGITVEAKDGGIEFIRVTDNGSGMDRDQIATAFLRHATSKIANADDLNRISSLGFRGEALSSIVAVSKVELITKTRDKLTGTRVLFKGTDIEDINEVGAPDGTTFIMRNLFYNTPVRRKFLKQPQTEAGYILELMEHLALSRPDISFKMILGTQTRFHTSGNGDLKEVIYRIYGKDAANNLVPIDFEDEGIRITGYLGKPVQVRSNRNHEIYFVNGRFVRSNTIAKAIEEGYKEYLMQHKFPFCVLHFTMDTQRVDVNVHPTKMDVRFSDSVLFFNTVSKAVRDTLKYNEMIPDAFLSREKEVLEKNTKFRTPEPFETLRKQEFALKEESKYRIDIPVMENFINTPDWVKPALKVQPEADACSNEGMEGKKEAKDVTTENVTKDDEGEDFFFEEAEPDVVREKAPETTAGIEEELPGLGNGADILSKPQQMNLFDEKMLTVSNKQKYRIIGQVFDTYWMIQFEDKLMIIDQHAAHEKVKYERFMKQYREKSVTTQQLMPPIIVSLSGKEETVYLRHKDVFLALGFEIENFGGSEYALRGVPTELYGCGEKQMFLEVLDELLEVGDRGNIRVIEEKIASMSCKAAVKGNNSLSMEEADKLIDELLGLENPYNCPHGRPTIVTISKYEMEKNFKRIV